MEEFALEKLHLGKRQKKNEGGPIEERRLELDTIIHKKKKK